MIPLESRQQEAYEAVLALLTGDVDGDKERLLWEIVQWEELNPPRDEEAAKYWGFEWYHVHGDARTLNSLVTRRILDVVYKSGSATLFKASDRAAIRRALEDYTGSLTAERREEQTPPDLFNIIIGHEAKKEILHRSISSAKPVHALLWGTPSSAKTLFLEELARLPGSHFVLGSSLTKAGLLEVLFTERPRYLILDELDKIDDPQNLAALLSLMERGIITETKHRRHKRMYLKTWVFASANEVIRIPVELMSRFLKLRFQDYAEEEFTDVVVNVLRDREGVTEGLALYVSQEVLRKLQSRDVRDAVRVARLLKTGDKEEVGHIIEILRQQR